MSRSRFRSWSTLVIGVLWTLASSASADAPQELPVPPERLILQRPAWLDGSTDAATEDTDSEQEVNIAPLLSPRKGPTARETLPGMYPENLGIYDGLGFWAGTTDRAFVLRLAGFTHIDSRYASGSVDGGSEYGMFLRRTRFSMDGRFFGKFEYRVMFDTLIDPLSPYDFHLDWRPIHEFNIRVGGFKSPFGLERRSRAYALLFAERGWPTVLAPNRDLGVYF